MCLEDFSSKSLTKQRGKMSEDISLWGLGAGRAMGDGIGFSLVTMLHGRVTGGVGELELYRRSQFLCIRKS
jgi:hypothetical protein